MGDDFVPGDEVAAPTGLGLSDAEEVVLLSSEDENVLTTALSRSIAVEDYELAVAAKSAGLVWGRCGTYNRGRPCWLVLQGSAPDVRARWKSTSISR